MVYGWKNRHTQGGSDTFGMGLVACFLLSIPFLVTGGQIFPDRRYEELVEYGRVSNEEIQGVLDAILNWKFEQEIIHTNIENEINRTIFKLIDLGELPATKVNITAFSDLLNSINPREVYYRLKKYDVYVHGSVFVDDRGETCSGYSTLYILYVQEYCIVTDTMIYWRNIEHASFDPINNQRCGMVIKR